MLMYLLVLIILVANTVCIFIYHYYYYYYYYFCSWIVVNIAANTLKNKVLHWKKNTLRL